MSFKGEIYNTSCLELAYQHREKEKGNLDGKYKAVGLVFLSHALGAGSTADANLRANPE